jgi:hypothetical protein
LWFGIEPKKTGGRTLGPAVDFPLPWCLANAQQHVHHQVAPEQREKLAAHVGIASIVAFQAIPYWTTYAATKAFVLAFGEGLAYELRNTGVRVGRATAGLTWATNSMCHLLWKASDERLLPERVYIAPHAPSFVLADMHNEEQLRNLNAEFRQLWNSTRATVELARSMFEGFPAFETTVRPAPTVDAAGNRIVHEMPPLRSPDDRFTAITRLRLVMEDPGQLLANSVASYIIDQLFEHGNRPAEVFIPGFTNVAYPRMPRGADVIGHRGVE